MADCDELAIPVAQLVTATYLVPVTLPHERIPALIRSAVAARVIEPVRSLALELLPTDLVRVEIQPAEVLHALTGLARGHDVTSEQAAPVTEAHSFAVITVEMPPWPGPVHEWVTRAAAGALAADLGVPVVDASARIVVSPEELLGSLPGSAETAESPGGFLLAQWLDVLDAGDGQLTTRGLVRFGLPELVIAGVPAQEAGPWEFGLYGLAYRLYRALRDELRQGRQPAFLAVPQELTARPADISAAAFIAFADIDGLPVRLSLDVTVGDTFQTRVAVDTPQSWPGTTAQHRAALREILRDAAVASLARSGHLGAGSGC